MNFHEVLKELIFERNLTQKQIAHDLKIPASTLGGYVQGTSEPDFEMLKTLAHYFDTTTDFLLGFKSKNANSFKEESLLRIFRTLSEEQQDLYLAQGQAFIKINSKDYTKQSNTHSSQRSNIG